MPEKWHTKFDRHMFITLLTGQGQQSIVQKNFWINFSFQPAELNRNLSASAQQHRQEKIDQICVSN